MVVHLVDPAAYTLPYDHALCEGIAAQGVEVHLYTSPFRYGSAPRPGRYRRHDHFYGAAAGRLGRLARHLPDELSYLRTARADVIHFQWLAAQPLDLLLLSAWPRRNRPPLVLTAHDILPREGLPGQRAAQRRLYRHFERVVVHSRYGEGALLELGVEQERIVRIPHPALRPHLAEGERAQLPAELAPPAGPVVLFAGILRPYKGLDLLLAAWAQLERFAAEREAVLWVCGYPRLDLATLPRPPRCQIVARYLREGELTALLEAGTVVVLPYRKLDSSGIALLAVGMGKPLLLSRAGSFPELADLGVARCVEAEDVDALAAALAELLDDEVARRRMGEAALAAAAGPLAAETVGAKTVALYRELVGEER